MAASRVVCREAHFCPAVQAFHVALTAVKRAPAVPIAERRPVLAAQHAVARLCLAVQPFRVPPEAAQQAAGAKFAVTRPVPVPVLAAAGRIVVDVAHFVHAAPAVRAAQATVAVLLVQWVPSEVMAPVRVPHLALVAARKAERAGHCAHVVPVFRFAVATGLPVRVLRLALAAARKVGRAVPLCHVVQVFRFAVAMALQVLVVRIAEPRPVDVGCQMPSARRDRWRCLARR